MQLPLLAHDFDLRTLWLMLLRRKWLIAVVVLVPSVLAYLVVKELPPYYTASAVVMIEPAPQPITQPPVTVNTKTGELELPPDRVQSEIQVIMSRDLGKKVVAKLRLMEDPEFNPTLRPHGPLRDLLPLDFLLPDSWVTWLEGQLPPAVVSVLDRLEAPSNPPEPGVDPAMLAVLDNFTKQLAAVQVGTSRAIEISFDSLDPVKAAKIANTLIDLYLVSQLDADLERTRRTNAWLSDQIAQLRDQVTKAEAAVEEYRARSGLLRGRDVTFTAQQVAEMSTELSKVKAERAQAEARLAALEHGGARGVDEVDTASLEQLKQLRVMEAEAAQQLASLAKDLGPRHPKYVAAQASLAQIRDRIGEERARVIGAARSEAMAARMREESLSADIDKLKAELAQANEAQVRLDELQREADASRTLLETFLARSKEQTMQQTFQQPNAKVLATADPPVQPSRPNKTVLMILSVFAFGIIGVSTAFAVEAFDRGFRSGEQIERLTQQRSLGLVPALGGMVRPSDYILNRPGSAFGEAIRNIYAGVVLPAQDSQPKLILVTSAVPREGKTTVVLSLARLLALSGKSVLVVDCDLRRPTVHRALGRPQDPGLVDLLLRREPLERVVQQDPGSPARFIAAGTAHRNAAALLGSPELPELLRGLRERYDVVLLDSAPVLAVADPRLLSTMVDKTVFLVRWGHGDRGGVSEALKRLVAAGADIAGVALTRVDLRRNARYGFSDSAYYGRSVRYYYR